MEIFKEKVLWIPAGLTVALLGAGLLFALIQIGGLGSPVILHFDQFRGVDFIGTVGDFWGIWLGGLALVGINAVLAGVALRRERFLAHLFLAANVLLSLFLFVFTIVVATAN